MEHKFKVPIGDWSDDGHGKCEYYVIKSNKPAEEVSKIISNCKKKLGFSTGDICSSYNDSCIKNEMLEKLLEIGVLKPEESLDPAKDYYYVEGPDEMVKIWMDILKYVDPSFEYEIVNDGLVTIYSGIPGYGLFD